MIAPVGRLPCREFRHLLLLPPAMAVVIPTQTRTKIMPPQQRLAEEQLVQLLEPQEGEGRRWPN